MRDELRSNKREREVNQSLRQSGPSIRDDAVKAQTTNSLQGMFSLVSKSDIVIMDIFMKGTEIFSKISILKEDRSGL